MNTKTQSTSCEDLIEQLRSQSHDPHCPVPRAARRGEGAICLCSHNTRRNQMPKTDSSIREFTEFDWYGLSGCEGWYWNTQQKKYQHQPLIRDIGDWMFIADSQGIYCLNEMEESKEYSITLNLSTQELARVFLQGLPDNLTSDFDPTLLGLHKVD